MSGFRKPHVDTVKSKHGVAPGWTGGLSADLDRAAARRAELAIGESLPSHKEEPVSYTSSQRVKLVIYTAGAKGKSSKGVRLKLPNDIVARLGSKVASLTFDVELDEDGIFLRPVNGKSSPDIVVPSWASGA
jgi:hypothetical protein